MSLRVFGWLLCLGAPGMGAGLALTMFFLVQGVPSRVPHFLSLGLWGVSAVVSAAGGYLSTTEGDARWRRAGTAAAGFAFGAAAFLVAMATADHLVSWM